MTILQAIDFIEKKNRNEPVEKLRIDIKLDFRGNTAHSLKLLKTLNTTIRAFEINPGGKHG